MAPTLEEGSIPMLESVSDSDEYERVAAPVQHRSLAKPGLAVLLSGGVAAALFAAGRSTTSKPAVASPEGIISAQGYGAYGAGQAYGAVPPAAPAGAYPAQPGVFGAAPGVLPGAAPPPPAPPSGPNGDGFSPCSDAEVTACPAEWLSAATGGYLCRKSKGCSPWTEEGGFFLMDDCPDQCYIGACPKHAHKPDTEAKPADGGDGGDDAGGDAGDAGAPADGDDDGEIHPCHPDEATCPDEWAFGEHGGYFCRTTKGCSEWTKTGGVFPDEVCPDQCTVGNTPSTRTITTTTKTITTTYPGMGIKLFCWSLAQPGYEFDILRRQMEMRAGIFACDMQLVMSFSKETIGGGDDTIETAMCEKMDAGTSKDGTSANTLQFMKAWEVIKNDKKYEKNDWTVKVDPDAVLLPDRLRIHLNPHNGGNTYIRNCNKPMSEGTMMFGALEAISKPALDGYYANFDKCNNEVPWQAWGEDLFMMRCLEHIGTSPSEDFGIIQDGVCNGVWCGDSNAAAFHPKKNVPDWEACWNEAVAAR